MTFTGKETLYYIIEQHTLQRDLVWFEHKLLTWQVPPGLREVTQISEPSSGFGSR